jgi:hypothetical protein
MMMRFAMQFNPITRPTSAAVWLRIDCGLSQFASRIAFDGPNIDASSFPESIFFRHISQPPIAACRSPSLQLTAAVPVPAAVAQSINIIIIFINIITSAIKNSSSPRAPGSSNCPVYDARAVARCCEAWNWNNNNGNGSNNNNNNNSTRRTVPTRRVPHPRPRPLYVPVMDRDDSRRRRPIVIRRRQQQLQYLYR